MTIEHAIEVPQRVRRSRFAERLARRAGDHPLAACVGIDPTPDALALLEGIPAGSPGRVGRTTRAGAIERFSGLLVESARDHAVAVKPQVAWFETAGAPGMRALERTIEFARTAGLLVVLDAKRGDVPHTAVAYADAWLGDAASNGAGVDAMTINGSIGIDAVAAMGEIAAERHAALYALVVTSNAGAAGTQCLRLEDGEPWWTHLARELASCDESLGGGVVGGVVGATRPELLARARMLMPTAPLLIPGVGAQGGAIEQLAPILAHARETSTPTTLVPISRSLLPSAPAPTPGFRVAVARAVEDHARALRTASSSPTTVG